MRPGPCYRPRRGCHRPRWRGTSWPSQARLRPGAQSSRSEDWEADKESSLFPLNIVPMCPRNGGRAECPVRERTRANQTATALLPPALDAPQLRFHLPGWSGNGERKPKRPPGRAPGPWAPATEVTQTAGASRRPFGEPVGGRRDSGAGGNEGPEACALAPRAPSRAAGNEVTWGAGLCRPL